MTTFGSNSVSVIDTGTNTVVTNLPIPVAFGITGVAITPDGTRAYVANGGGSVVVVDIATNTLIASISVGATAVAITPDGTLAYTANLSTNFVSVINTSTNSLVATVPLGLGTFPEPFNVAITHPITVAIDVKPGQDPAVINVKSQGKIPVAILSSSVFNALTGVDTTSLTFGRTGNEGSLVSCNAQDVNGDGLLDLVCFFSAQTSAFQKGDTVGTLKAKTPSGIAIVGTDSVVVH